MVEITVDTRNGSNVRRDTKKTTVFIVGMSDLGESSPLKGHIRESVGLSLGN
jgi:hypothetical protein